LKDEDNTPLTTQIRTTQDMTPHKFSCPHVIARFSPGGILLRVLPNSPKDGVAAHIEFHDLNALLGDLPTAQEMKFFPGTFPFSSFYTFFFFLCKKKWRNL
jgi:hypothetical protein